MIINSKIEFKEYIKVTYRHFFKRPLTLIILVMFLFTLSFRFFTSRNEFSNDSYFDLVRPIIIFFTLFLIVLPVFIYFTRKRWFYNSKLKETIIYEFTDDKMKLKGETFSSEIEWRGIYKVEVEKDIVLIYHNKMVANYVSKRAFGSNLNEFIEIIKNQKNIILKT